MAFQPLRYEQSFPNDWTSEDTLVLIGELVPGGYVNGLVAAAQRRGMKIIETTVGRREPNGKLVPLSTEQWGQKRFLCINVPIEAGFDYEENEAGETPISVLRDLKMQDWSQFRLDPSSLQTWMERGRKRLRQSLDQMLGELEPLLPARGRVIFAHLMAGGVPRSKVVLALLNRVVRGHGAKYFSSEDLWQSDLGRLIEANFFEVTAQSFELLLESTKDLRERLEASGRRVCYTAYGYHGTEIFIGNQWRWQSYVPYLQGWAKLKLEEIAKSAIAQGIHATVYNCPEILTQSSSIFNGVELPLYPLLAAFKQLAPEHKATRLLWQYAKERLKSDVSVEAMLSTIDEAYATPELAILFDYSRWPGHNEPQQMARVLQTSERVLSMHRDEKDVITFELSRIVLQACGEVMLRASSAPTGHGVLWLGHDVVTKTFIELMA
jgi:hypothetical protein